MGALDDISVGPLLPPGGQGFAVRLRGRSGSDHPLFQVFHAR